MGSWRGKLTVGRFGRSCVRLKQLEEQMKKMVCVMLTGLVGLVGTATAEDFAIYQVVDMAGKAEYQVLSKVEFAKLATEIKEEQKVLTAVIAAAKKEWESDKENKTTPFPASKIKSRMFKKLSQDFPKKETAEERLILIEERAAKKMEEDKKDKSKNRGAKSKADPEDTSKDALKQMMANNAIADVNRRMAEKLGREVPTYGFVGTAGKKEAKAAPAKEVKKDDAKKEAEKKPAH
jgi:ribosomal protein S13